MNATHDGLHTNSQLMRLALVAAGVLFAAAALSAPQAQAPKPQAARPQTPEKGIVKPFSEVKFGPDDDVKCLNSVLENGDPASGPSTFIIKASSKCVVAPHYHAAEEQLIVVRGELSTGMEGMSTLALGPGGFAMMPGKRVHWFTCTSKDACLMFVTFDRTFDIVWTKPQK